jgi:hypothetical protein
LRVPDRTVKRDDRNRLFNRGTDACELRGIKFDAIGHRLNVPGIAPTAMSNKALATGQKDRARIGQVRD